MPTSPTFLLPSCFSTISCASRTSVRSISEADISRPFSRNLGFRASVVSLITIALDDIRTALSRRKPSYRSFFLLHVLPSPSTQVQRDKVDRVFLFEHDLPAP